MTIPDAAVDTSKKSEHKPVECALRHPAAGFAMVRGASRFHHCCGGVQRDSNAGSDASLRSAGLAACRAGVRGKEAVYLGVLAPCDYPGGVWARNRGVVVMNTTAFDGRWTRQVIEWLGFGTAQGSSSRGGLRGLAVMARRLEEGSIAPSPLTDRVGPRVRRQAGTSDAGAENGMSDPRLSRWG